MEVSLEEIKQCSNQYVLAIHDTLNVISGKWKLAIIGSLLYDKKRFKDLQENIGKITPRMLSKELKELEVNDVVKRMVYDTKPVKVEYELTNSGEELAKVLDTLINWGVNHREMVLHNKIK